MRGFDAAPEWDRLNGFDHSESINVLGAALACEGFVAWPGAHKAIQITTTQNERVKKNLIVPNAPPNIP
jgi:hypothetical protein